MVLLTMGIHHASSVHKYGDDLTRLMILNLNLSFHRFEKSFQKERAGSLHW